MKFSTVWDKRLVLISIEGAIKRPKNTTTVPSKTKSSPSIPSTSELRSTVVDSGTSNTPILSTLHTHTSIASVSADTAVLSNGLNSSIPHGQVNESARAPAGM